MKSELLAPAGNLEKLSYAYRYGADAAYIGIKAFSLRARAENFHAEEFDSIRRIKGDKKLYAALNIYFHPSDIRSLEENLDYLAEYPLDAFIVSDLGAARLLQKRFPNIPLHLSTQANCINGEAVKVYRGLGFNRIILGRETSVSDIKEIRRAVPEIELEAFVHGAMCLAYSGRCFLSAYMAGRSANEGNCSHSCRWDYRVLEESKRPGEYYPVETGEGFTTILSSKDLCMIDHLEELQEAGVDSFKIEGRMKSIYYTAVVTRAYRKALDSLEGKPDPGLPAYREDLFNVSHREYSSGFYFDRTDIETPTRKSYQRSYMFLGSLRKQHPEQPELYELDVKNQILSSDSLEYIGPDIPYLEDTGFVLMDENLTPVEKADHGSRYYIRPAVPAAEGYILRKAVSGE
ncbi:U32 family peptidase [Marispirochaeta sp.]|uniref:peptidase U32 family protein n=1 Tax=Marispirochaeta sp. TaxID=2038653 RepID=UPI0029C767F0|nr:U32 family peptidase [Marispirochaeta sp.]